MIFSDFDDQFQKSPQVIAGVDEAGRGAWAGPVCAAAVILPAHYDLPGLNDSKKLTPQKRSRLSDQIKEQALSFGIGLVDAYIIDQINIWQATQKAMLKAIDCLDPQPELLLVDGKHKIQADFPQEAIVDGDALSPSIAAASILAKVARDSIMDEWGLIHRDFGFEKHKGYGTKQHREALSKWGILDIHRKSYKPIADLSLRETSL